MLSVLFVTYQESSWNCSLKGVRFLLQTNHWSNWIPLTDTNYIWQVRIYSTSRLNVSTKINQIPNIFSSYIANPYKTYGESLFLFCYSWTQKHLNNPLVPKCEEEPEPEVQNAPSGNQAQPQTESCSPFQGFVEDIHIEMEVSKY